MTTNPFAALLAGVPRFDGYGTFDPDGDVVRLSDVLAALAAAVPADLAEAGKVVEGVTPSKAPNVWRVQKRYSFICHKDTWQVLWDVPKSTSVCLVADTGGDTYSDERDARFIAWCREGVPALLARIAGQEAQIKGLKAERNEAINQLDSANHSIDVLEKRVAHFMERTEAAETAIADMTKERDGLLTTWAESRKRHLTAETALAAERAKVAKLVEAGKALGLREIVAGWNGEGRDTPYTPHPAHLWATIKTTCGAVYALDAAITEAGQ